ncbi:MAG TPA: GWxTD domain-containing protein [Thermoanaerobaculia bacterium]|nr:GWxTD domain-containing protein [Thermoanaerobaculia bacterium]
MKKVLFALAGLAIAASALAQFAKNKDWDKSPEAYFLTPAERTEWKSVSTDEEADKFIALYFARRGGDAFKQEISRRIAAADQQFKMQRYKRGADSVRGHLLIVLGAPSRVSQTRAQEGPSVDTGTILGVDTRSSAVGSSAIEYSWTYLADKFPTLGLPEFKAQVTVDPVQGRDILQNSKEIENILATLAEKSIVNPNATLAAAPAAAAPGAPAAAKGGAPAAAPAAAVAPVPTMPLPAAVKASLEGVAGKSTGEAGFWSGTFRSATGDQFLALQFYVPTNKPAFSAAMPLKFGGVVTDESGKEVDSYWEDATFTEVTEGARKDRVFDRSVTLQPGSYKGVFGLFTAEGQPPVASSSIAFKLDPKSTEFEVSPLILSNGLVPLTKRPGPADPFVFGTEKPIKVDPKGDHLFSKTDSLWYFYSVDNPTLPAVSADAPAPSATPAAGAAPAPAAAAAAPKPRVMTRINVQRDGQDAFAPFTGPAELVQTAPGVYSTGNEIPLASFEPGYYTFLISVRDLNAAKGSAANKGLDRREDFVVLMPDGSLPPKAAPKPAAPPKKKS